MTAIGTRPLLLAALLATLAGCSGGDGAPDGADVATAASSLRADSAATRGERLAPGVTVDTQKIEDSTVAELYTAEDSLGGR